MFAQNITTFAVYLLAAFAFVSCLIILFSVVTDLARDRELSGWAKALWFIFLIFVPFLTVLAYIVVRGDGMAERAAHRAEQEKDSFEAYIRRVAGHNAAQEIETAKRLLDAGTISQDEFDSIKRRALA